MQHFLDNYFKFIKKTFPSARQGSFIGLDIGPMACRAVELVRRPSGFELVSWRNEPCAGIPEKDAVAKIVAGLGIDKAPRPVLTCVSGRGTLIRYIDMPRMSARQLQQALVFDSDRYLPFPRDTIYIDSFIFDPKGNDNKMAVLLAAVKKEIIDARLKLLKECGLEADVITLGAMATANAFAAFMPDSLDRSEKMTALIDIGDAATNLMIMEGRSPRFNRDIFIGVQEILKRLENLSGIGAMDGRILLHDPKDKADAVRQAVDAIMANLIGEIRLSFDYFVTEKNMQISRIILVGEGALVAGVRKIFEDNFGIPLVSWDPFEKISVAPGVDQEGLRRDAPQFVTALGLALNEYD